ncbi:MAG: glycosyltransferase [Acinetobacter sp.]|nr:MAG: glycosyltransferase [Acinetobacter sp.]
MKSVLLVLDEIPVLNTTGHTTYNNAFLTALVASGFEVTMLITGNRFVKPVFNVDEDIGVSGVNCVIPAAFKLRGNSFIGKPIGLAKWLLRRPVISKIRRSSARSNNIYIGNWLSTSAAAKFAVGLVGRNFDYVFIDTIFRYEVIKHLPKNICSILVGHDVFHQRCVSLDSVGLNPLPFVTIEQERQVLANFDGVIAITAEEALIYESLLPECRVIALPSPIETRVSVAIRCSKPRVLYVASRAQINVDGLIWFLDSIWPKVKERHPEAVLDVVGSIGPELRRVDPGVCVHGRVDDYSVIASQAMCAINPIRAGSGLKIKMLDYFSYGLGCITTPAGAAGFPPDDESPIAVAADDAEFAALLNSWLANSTLCHQQSERAIRYVQQFSPESFARRLCCWIHALGSNAAHELSTGKAP